MYEYLLLKAGKYGITLTKPFFENEDDEWVCKVPLKNELDLLLFNPLDLNEKAARYKTCAAFLRPPAYVSCLSKRNVTV